MLVFEKFGGAFCAKTPSELAQKSPIAPLIINKLILLMTMNILKNINNMIQYILYHI